MGRALGRCGPRQMGPTRLRGARRSGAGLLIGGDPVHRLQVGAATSLPRARQRGSACRSGARRRGGRSRRNGRSHAGPARAAASAPGTEQLSEVHVVSGRGERSLYAAPNFVLSSVNSASRIAAGVAPGNSGSPVRGCSSKDHSAVTPAPWRGRRHIARRSQQGAQRARPVKDPTPALGQGALHGIAPQCPVSD
jgi:hypothetical protein